MNTNKYALCAVAALLLASGNAIAGDRYGHFAPYRPYIDHRHGPAFYPRHQDFGRHNHFGRPVGAPYAWSVHRHDDNRWADGQRGWGDRPQFQPAPRYGAPYAWGPHPHDHAHWDAGRRGWSDRPQPAPGYGAPYAWDNHSHDHDRWGPRPGSWNGQTATPATSGGTPTAWEVHNQQSTVVKPVTTVDYSGNVPGSPSVYPGVPGGILTNSTGMPRYNR